MVSDTEPVDQPVIVDCDILEAAKENVQPMLSGRRVTSLSSTLLKPHAQREAMLGSTRNKLQINIQLALEDEDGDPLEAYCALVYWTLEHYPSASSSLLELVEQATRVLKDHQQGRYRQDPRYVKLWILYAGFVEKPTIIFSFMLANEIGTDAASLYEHYATALEREGRYVTVASRRLLVVSFLIVARRPSRSTRLRSTDASTHWTMSRLDMTSFKEE